MFMLNQLADVHQKNQAPPFRDTFLHDDDHKRAQLNDRPHYTYDPAETLDLFRARQARAFGAGRRAWRERLIKAQLLPFYEALVSYVGQNQYAWVKEQTLADEFEVHVATIKRWLAKLEDAGLIRRQRRFATSSLTFITAYDDEDGQVENTDNQITTPKQEDVLQDDYRQDREVPNGGRNAPMLGAKMHRDSINNEKLMLVGGKESAKQQLLSPEIRQILTREGVMDYALAPTIQQKPFVELQAISGYLSRQRNVRDRPRLFAWLASRDFGAQLLHGRRSTRGSTCVDVQTAAMPQVTQVSVNSPIGENTPTSGASSTSCCQNQALWQSVLTTLQRDVPPAEFATWLKDTALLDVDHEWQIAVVGTPNVFARDAVQQCYIPPLSTELSAHLHQSYAIHVVVDGR